ncbi:MAG: sterol desaturase family protein [Pirellulaceae bacterium]
MSPGLEISIRLGCFLGVLLLMAAWEFAAPRRRLQVKRPRRWASNLLLVAINTGVVRVLVPLTAVAAALWAESRDWGLLHVVDLPMGIEVVLAVVALDLAIYVQHVLFHKVPLLWRMHLVHHADLDIDVTTGVRFHTLEILLSTLIKIGVVVLLGAPALAVLVFEVLLNATSMFNHSNINLPVWLDRLMRLVVVTPDMHRVHHSVVPRETNSNFGFNLPWWDRLFRTYRPQPEAGHQRMQIGLTPLRDERQVDRLPGMLLLPFRWRSDPGANGPENDHEPKAAASNENE